MAAPDAPAACLLHFDGERAAAARLALAQARGQVAQVAFERADDAAGHVVEARAVGVDDAKAGVSQAGVNA